MSLNKESNWKEAFVEVGKWLIFAFAIGMFFTLGGEIVKYYFPAKQQVTIVKHIHTVSPDLKD